MQAAQLLARWGTLHGVRSVLSRMAFLPFLYLSIFTKPTDGHANGAASALRFLRSEGHRNHNLLSQMFAESRQSHPRSYVLRYILHYTCAEPETFTS
jgi:hypothetical protein